MESSKAPRLPTEAEIAKREHIPDGSDKILPKEKKKKKRRKKKEYKNRNFFLMEKNFTNRKISQKGQKETRKEL